MDFDIVNTGTVINETLFDGNGETSAECDVIIPDYQPDIFKVIRVEATPMVQSRGLRGDKAFAEGVVLFKMLYLTENRKALRSIKHKCSFSHTFTVPNVRGDAAVKIKVRTERINCKVLNPRKISFKASLHAACKVTVPAVHEMVGEVENAETLKRSAAVYVPAAEVEKTFSIDELLEIGHGRPPILEILKSDVTLMQKDIKILPDKALVKGEALIRTFYLADEETGATEIIEHELPFSQVVELEGADETCGSEIIFELADFNIEPRTDSGGENRLMAVDLSVNAITRAYRNIEISILADAFSSEFNLTMRYKDIVYERLNDIIDDKFISHETIERDGLAGVLESTVVPMITMMEFEEKNLCISGKLECSALIINQEGEISNVDTSVPFKYSKEIKDITEHMRCDVNIYVASHNCTVINPSRAELRAELTVNGMLFSKNTVQVISDITVSEVKENPERPNIILYYVRPGERLWDIAKKYRTPMNIICEMNSLDHYETIREKRMLVIPGRERKTR